MNTSDSRSTKKPLRWAWYIVIPAILLTGLTACIGPFLWSEAVIRHLESQDVMVYRLASRTHRPSFMERIPGFENWGKPAREIEIEWRLIGDGALPDILQEARKLRVPISVDLIGTKQLNQNLKDLEGANVVWLVLVGQELNSESFRMVAKLAPLRELSLVECEFNNRHLLTLKKLTQLKRVDLDRSSIDDKGVRSLSAMANLEIVSLSNTQVSESAKEDLCRALPNLQVTDD